MLKPSSLLNFPVFGAFSVVFGVLLERLELPFWVAFAVATLALLSLLSKLPLAVRYALAVALLLCPLAWWRSHVTRVLPDNLEPFVGKTITLTGDYDGRFFGSGASRVFLRVKPALEMGVYSITGKLERPKWFRNPGVFDLGAWMLSRGARYILRAKEVVPLESGVLGAARAWVRSGVRAGLQPREAALMTGVALGDPDELNGIPVTEDGTAWRDVFAKSGLAHIMALSGQQVTIIVLGLSFALRGLMLWRFPVLIVVLLSYWAVVGAAPSVSRAILMGLAVLVTGWLGRGRLEVLPSIGLSAVLTLLWQPAWLADLGWLLSYLAVLGMVLFVPPMLGVLRLKPPDENDVNPKFAHIRGLKFLTFTRVRFWVVGIFATTLAAQALTLPLTASSFGLIPLISPISNLFAELLMLPLVILSFMAGVLGAAGGLVNVVIQPLAWLMLEGAKFFSNAPVLEWGSVSTLGYVAFYASVAAIYAALVGWMRPYQMLAVMLAAVLVTALPNRSRAEIVYLDVGQGDSTLIRLPVGDILVDAGGTPQSDFDIGSRVVVPALRSLGVKSLTVIATHGDTDHIEGVSAVLRHFPVSSLIIGHDKPIGEDAVWDAMITVAKSRNIPIRVVGRGMQWKLGVATINFLHPAPPFNLEDDNINSVAFSLEYNNKRLLFLGDAPSEVEDTMNPGAVDVLKLAHHGSRFSTGETLLRRTIPKAVVISSGADNTYGHPSKEVLERLKPYNPKAFRTDRDGAITYSLNTGTWRTLMQNPEAGLLGQPQER
jgi:competence protein ComEC